jgi:hypothetical protein
MRDDPYAVTTQRDEEKEPNLEREYCCELPSTGLTISNSSVQGRQPVFHKSVVIRIRHLPIELSATTSNHHFAE